jgi:hypothetical protein
MAKLKQIEAEAVAKNETFLKRVDAWETKFDQRYAEIMAAMAREMAAMEAKNVQLTQRIETAERNMQEISRKAESTLQDISSKSEKSLKETAGRTEQTIRQAGERAGHRRHLLVEHFVAQPLRLPDLALLAREPHFEGADAAVDFRRMPGAEASRPRPPAPGEGQQTSMGRPKRQSWDHGKDQAWKHRAAAESLRDAPGCQLHCHVSARLAVN